MYIINETIYLILLNGDNLWESKIANSSVICITIILLVTIFKFWGTTRKLIDKRILYFNSLTIKQDEYQKVIEISNLDITFQF